MRDCLTFDAEEKALAAQRRIWINRVRKRAAEGENLVGTGIVHYSDLSGLTDDRIAGLKIYSERNGRVDPSLNGTTMPTRIDKAHSLDKWHVPKPEEDLMDGVEDYAVEPYSVEWEAPFEV